VENSHDQNNIGVKIVMDLYSAADIFIKVCGLALLGMLVQEVNALRHFWTWLYEEEDGEDTEADN